MLPLSSTGQCHYTVAFSPDGRWLAAGGSAYAVDVWDLHSPQEAARRLPGLSEPIVRVQFTSTDRVVIVGMSRVSVVNSLTAPPRRIPNPIETGAEHVRRAVISPEADLVVMVCNDGLYRWSLSPRPALDWVRRDTPRGILSDVALTANARLIVAGAGLEIRNA